MLIELNQIQTRANVITTLNKYRISFKWFLCQQNLYISVFIYMCDYGKLCKLHLWQFICVFLFLFFELILKFYQANEVCVRDAW